MSTGRTLAVRMSVVVCVLLLPAAALAADVTGKITDRSGGVLPRAAVTALNIVTGETRSGTADEQGRYRIANVAPGTYVVTVMSAGFSSAVRTVIVPAAETPLAVDFTLDVGLQREDVTVTAARG